MAHALSHAWFKNYSSQKTVCAIYKHWLGYDRHHMWGPTVVSVSVCGPLLFLMCVNDITEYFIQNVFLLIIIWWWHKNVLWTLNLGQAEYSKQQIMNLKQSLIRTVQCKLIIGE